MFSFLTFKGKQDFTQNTSEEDLKQNQPSNSEVKCKNGL